MMYRIFQRSNVNYFHFPPKQPIRHFLGSSYIRSSSSSSSNGNDNSNSSTIVTSLQPYQYRQQQNKQQRHSFSSTKNNNNNNHHHDHNHHYNDIQITGVSDEVASSIKQYANKQQTSASLQTLMKTGRGELIHKTYGGKNNKVVMDPEEAQQHQATDKILMQVCIMYIMYMLYMLYMLYE